LLGGGHEPGYGKRPSSRRIPATLRHLNSCFNNGPNKCLLNGLMVDMWDWQDGRTITKNAPGQRGNPLSFHLLQIPTPVNAVEAMEFWFDPKKGDSYAK
jgi:hypothetical protein